MRTIFLSLLALLPLTGRAQHRETVMPEFTYTDNDPDRYGWKKAAVVHDRSLFGNAIACTDSTIYSFGGYDLFQEAMRRELNILDRGRLKPVAIRYPGKGFYENIFFIRDSVMYMGGGRDSSESRYAENDFWRYDMRTHVWQQLHQLPFYYLYPPVVFNQADKVTIMVPELRGKDFLQTGTCFYNYDPDTDTWTAMYRDSPTPELRYPVAFRQGDKIFVLFQTDRLFNKPVNNFYRFDLSTHEWTAMPRFPGATRLFAFACSDDRYGYIGGGSVNASDVRDVYRFDPVREQWERCRDLPRPLRHAVGWQFHNQLYIGFGISNQENNIVVWKLRQRR